MHGGKEWGRSHSVDVIIDKDTYGGSLIDDKRYLYVADVLYPVVRQYRKEAMTRTLVVNGRGQGVSLNHLHHSYHTSEKDHFEPMIM